MRVLDLFSGAQSVGKVCREHGWEYVSLDRDLPADIQCDIMTWDCTVYEPGHFDVITASPVCSFWSSLRACNTGRKIKGADTGHRGDRQADDGPDTRDYRLLATAVLLD